MKTNLREFTNLQQEHQRSQRRYQEAKGALKQQLEQLKTECGVSTLEEAKELVERKKKRIKILERKYSKKMKAFKSKWKGLN